MDEAIFQQLKACKIFASLEDDVLKKISEQCEVIHLKKNKILFRQGEVSDSLYVLVSGKIFVFLTPEKKHKKFIAEILPGQTLGELAALSNEPRSTTTKTAEDCTLLQLSGKVFTDICLQYPKVSFAVINSFITRSDSLVKFITEEGNARKHIVLLPAHADTALALLQKKLTAILSNHSKITLISDQQSFASASDVETWINTEERKGNTIIYALYSTDSLLAKACLEYVDMIYIVAEAGSDIFLNKKVREILQTYQYKIKPELILLHQKHKSLPKNTKPWLKLYRFNLHHHIRIHHAPDWQRLLRFMHNKAVGVVLGGGGLRCWAQLGALKALHEAKIPIDIIGGTSAGSIVSAFYALHETFEDRRLDLRRLSEATRKAISLKNLTWPAVSLFNGEDYTRCLQSIFAKVKIENLWLPAFFISCNLMMNKQMITRSGSLWRSIRSSTSVPAIFPPLTKRGKIYLDGGILNNLPVDVMQKIIGHANTTIAIELTRGGENNHHYDFPTILPFWKTLFAKLGIAFKKYSFPPFVETFLQSLLAGASAKQRENAALADILVAPDLSHFGLLSVTAEQENELYDIGYQETQEAIKKWRRKHPAYSFAIA